MIDYAHATQNLYEIVELAGSKHRPRLFRRWKTLLFQGKMDELGKAIRTVFCGTKLKQALKKWKNYFPHNFSFSIYFSSQTEHVLYTFLCENQEYYSVRPVVEDYRLKTKERKKATTDRRLIPMNL